MNTHTAHNVTDLAAPTGKSFTRHFPAVARVLMGLPLAVFGLNAFLNFIPQPTTPMPEGATAFLGALMKSGYMMQLIGATQLITGAFLLTNRFVPLALALFAPFIVNSIAFHVFLEPSGLPLAIVVSVLSLVVLAYHRPSFAGLVKA